MNHVANSSESTSKQRDRGIVDANKVTEGIRRFATSTGASYSKSGKAWCANSPSRYGVLYHLNLMHLLGETDKIETDLAKLQGELENGLLAEIPEYAQGGGTTHSAQYVRLHLSSIYYQLAHTYLPDHPPATATLNWTPEDVTNWLNQLDYSDEWNTSNIVMALGLLLAHNSRKGVGHPGVLETCLDHIQSRQDERTGLWLGSRNRSVLNGVASAFHYVPLHAYLGRPIEHAKPLLKSVLSLQLRNGFFCSPAGYACIDYDCASIINQVLRDDHQGNLDSDVRFHAGAAINALHEAICNLQNDDGGFPDFGPTRNPIVETMDLLRAWSRNRCVGTLTWNLKKVVRLQLLPGRPILSNSISACRASARESNTFATWFRYLTLQTCEEAMELLQLPHTRLTAPSKFSLPGLGYA